MPMTTTAVLHVIAYMILAGPGFLLLYAALKASAYAARDWRRGDFFWVWQEVRDGAAYAVIGLVLLFCAFSMLPH